MDLSLYDLNNGVTYNTGAVSFSIPTSGELEQTIVSGVSGKKIVPVWIVMTKNAMGAGADFGYTLTSGSTDLIKSAMQSLFTWPLFNEFGCDFITAAEEGEDLKVTCYGTSTETCRVTVGYYIV
jgi:hypothetical protein